MSEDVGPPNAPIFDPFPSLAAFDYIREIYHHRYLANRLEAFHPAEEYVRLLDMGWLNAGDFDWPDAAAVLKAGRAVLSSSSHTAYSIPNLPLPNSTERIRNQARYCKDIALTAAKVLADSRARYFGEPDAVPMRRERERELKVVFMSLVRSVRALENRHVSRMEVSQMIQDVTGEEDVGITKKRPREEVHCEALQDKGDVHGPPFSSTRHSMATCVTSQMRIGVVPDGGEPPAKIRKVMHRSTGLPRLTNPTARPIRRPCHPARTSNRPSYTSRMQENVTERQFVWLGTPGPSNRIDEWDVHPRRVRFVEPVGPYGSVFTNNGRGVKRGIDCSNEGDGERDKCSKRFKSVSTQGPTHNTFPSSDPDIRAIVAVASDRPRMSQRTWTHASTAPDLRKFACSNARRISRSGGPSCRTLVLPPPAPAPAKKQSVNLHEEGRTYVGGAASEAGSIPPVPPHIQAATTAHGSTQALQRSDTRRLLLNRPVVATTSTQPPLLAVPVARSRLGVQPSIGAVHNTSTPVPGTSVRPPTCSFIFEVRPPGMGAAITQPPWDPNRFTFNF